MPQAGKIGIVGYGSYIPRYRIRLEEIAKVWGADAEAYKRGLQLYEKSVPGPDQDVITMSVEAARRAGISRATSAVPRSASGTAVNVTASVGLMP
jgi:3-hydroxy-3-methylglutaryl CoA synthase